MHYAPRRAQRGLSELITHYELRIMNYALNINPPVPRTCPTGKLPLLCLFNARYP